MGKQIQIKLLPNGQIEMETHGVKGKKCTDYIKLLEQLADAKIQDVNFTPEYYEEEKLYYSQTNKEYLRQKDQ